MPSSGYILIYGYDIDLLHTRRLVLQQAGFNVDVLTRLKDVEEIAATHEADLLILCHSLSPDECKKALKLAHSRQRALKCLVLVTRAPVCRLGEGDELLSSFDGPGALVSAVTKLLHAAGSSRESSASSSLKRKLMEIGDSSSKSGLIQICRIDDITPENCI